jgi:hypothetical protein
MQIITQNRTDQKRRGWVDVAVPYWHHKDDEPNARYRLTSKPRWPIVRGPHVGTWSTLLHVYGEWFPGETVSGSLSTSPDGPWDVPFFSTDWVVDHLDDLIPIPMIQLEEDGEIIQGTDFFNIELVEESPIRQVWRGHGRMTGTMLCFRAWVYIYAGQDPIRVEYEFTNSDPRSTEITQHFQNLGIKTGEFFEMDFRDYWGLPYPVQDVDGKWVQIVTGPKKLDDPQQVAFTGWMLCLPRDRSKIDPREPETAQRIANLVAHLQLPGKVDDKRGPLYAMCTSWDGHWGPFGVLPEFPTTPHPGIPMTPQLMVGRWLGYLENRGDIFDQRPGNLAKSAGQTGSQEDFGASKGGDMIVAEEPSLMHRLLLGVNEHMRPAHNREVDARAMVARAHPKLLTWSQLAFGRAIQDADSLGKGFQEGGWTRERNGTGYSGIDDQHRSQNTLSAYIALTGSHWAQSLMFDFMQVDFAQQTAWMDAPRAEGRLNQAWANTLMLLNPHHDTKQDWKPDLIAHMKKRMATTLKDWSGGKVEPHSAIRVMSWTSHINVLKKEVTDPDTGEKSWVPVPAWQPWQHSIACMGFRAAELQLPEEDRSDFTMMRKTMAEMITRYGCYHDGMRWRCCVSVRYRLGDDEGLPLPEDAYGQTTGEMMVDDSWWRWTLPAVIICESTTDDEDLAKRARSIIADVRPDSGPVDWNQAEWWAVA